MCLKSNLSDRQVTLFDMSLWRQIQIQIQELQTYAKQTGSMGFDCMEM